MATLGISPPDSWALRGLQSMFATARGGCAAKTVPRLATLCAGVVVADAEAAGGEGILFLGLFRFAAILDPHFLCSLVNFLLRDLPEPLTLIVVVGFLLNAAVVLLFLVLHEILEDFALLELLRGDDCNLWNGRE